MEKMIRCGASNVRDDWKSDCGHPVAIPKFTIIRARGMVLSAKVGTLRMRGSSAFSPSICLFEQPKAVTALPD
jgi:hypothetical protein